MWIYVRNGDTGGTWMRHTTGDTLPEIYYLRMLLSVKQCPKTLDDLRTVYGVVHPTFKEACLALGLCNDDSEYIKALMTASEYSTGDELRRLFVVMLLCGSIFKPKEVWEATNDVLLKGVLEEQRRSKSMSDMLMTVKQLQVIALSKIDELLRLNGSSLAMYPELRISQESPDDEC